MCAACLIDNLFAARIPKEREAMLQMTLMRLGPREMRVIIDRMKLIGRLRPIIKTRLRAKSTSSRAD